MEDAKRVMVTGAAGAIGRAVVRTLQQAGHFVRGVDVVKGPPGVEWMVGSIVDAELMKRACVGMTAVIHLAAVTDDADFFEKLLPHNVVGLVNVLEGARLAGVKRVSLASSMQVAEGFKAWGNRVLKVEEGTRPKNGYAATKVFAEAMGHVYFARYGMEVVCPRIGWLPRNAEGARHIQRCGDGGRAVFLSHDDVGRFYQRVVEAEKICGAEEGYAVVYVASKRRRVEGPDLEAARVAVGYEPQDEFPAGLPGDWEFEADARHD